MTVIGYAPGAFDLFHIGHLNILRRAREQCDYLIGGVVTDRALLQSKGREPVVPFEERLEIVRAIRYVDEALADRHTDKFEAWREIGYHVLFKGDDWRGTERGTSLERRLAAVGVRVRYFPYTMHTSTSTLRKRIADSA